MAENNKKNLKFLIIFQGSQKHQLQASKILQSAWQNNKRVQEVKTLDIWTKLIVNIPQSDPYFNIDPKTHLPSLLGYLYKNNQPLSLRVKPELNKERLDLAVLTKYIIDESPTIIIALDPLVRDILLSIRRKNKLPIGIVSVPTRFNTDIYWPSEEGDLWAVMSEENREHLLSEFVDNKRIIVSGLLISKKELKLIEKPLARKKNGWPQNGLIIGIVADGLLKGQLEEFIERISAYPDMQLSLIIFTSDNDFQTNLEEKAQGFLATVKISRLSEDLSEVYSGLDLILSSHDQIYIPEILAHTLPSIIIAKKRSFTPRDEELANLSAKNLIWRAVDMREAVWRIEHVLKDKKILKDLKNQIKQFLLPKPAADKILEEIILRLNKK